MRTVTLGFSDTLTHIRRNTFLLNFAIIKIYRTLITKKVAINKVNYALIDRFGNIPIQIQYSSKPGFFDNSRPPQIDTLVFIMFQHKINVTGTEMTWYSSPYDVRLILFLECISSSLISRLLRFSADISVELLKNRWSNLCHNISGWLITFCRQATIRRISRCNSNSVWYVTRVFRKCKGTKFII